MLPIALEVESAMITETNVDTEGEEVEVTRVVIGGELGVCDHVRVVGRTVAIVEMSTPKEPHLLG